MQKYEIALIISAKLDQVKQQKIIKDFEKFVKNNDGKLIKSEQWEERELAYPIKHEDKGVYFFAHYELSADKNTGLLKELNINLSILRQMIIIPPKGADLKTEKELLAKPVKKSKRDDSKKKFEKKEKIDIPKKSKKVEKTVEIKEEELETKKDIVKPKVDLEKTFVETKTIKDTKDDIKEEEKKPAVKAPTGLETETKAGKESKFAKKTVEESKKRKAKEQKAKKIPEEDLDREIDRILSDEDLL